MTLPPRPPAPLEPDPLWPVVKGQPAYGCPCCGQPLPWERGGFFICQSCGWEDDPSDAAYPTSRGGPNHISMARGREGYWWRSWRGAGRWRPPGHASPPELQARALEWLLNKETLTPACEALLMKARGRFKLTGPQRARLRAASLQEGDDETVFIDVLENLSACRCALTERRGEAWRPKLEALAEARGQAAALAEVMALREAWQRHIASDVKRAPWLRQAPDISAFWPDHFEDYERLQRAGYLEPEALEGFEEVEERLLEDLEHATDDPWDLVYSCNLESLPGWLKLGALSAPTRQHLAERLERALGATPELREHAEPEVLPLLSLL